MKLRLCLFANLLILFTPISTLCLADESTNGWSGEGSLNANITTGSTDTTNVGLGVKLNRVINDWTVKLRANADYGDAATGKNKNHSYFSALVDYDIGETWLGFIQGDYRFNEISNYQYKSTLGAGFGYRIYDQEKIDWTVRGSLGVRIEEAKFPKKIDSTGKIISVIPDDSDTGGTREDTKNANLDIQSDYSYQFSEDVAFASKLNVGLSEEKIETRMELTLSAAISSALSARFEFDLLNDSEPGDEVVATETTTRFSLVYKF